MVLIPLVVPARVIRQLKLSSQGGIAVSSYHPEARLHRGLGHYYSDLGSLSIGMSSNKMHSLVVHSYLRFNFGLCTDSNNWR